MVKYKIVIPYLFGSGMMVIWFELTATSTKQTHTSASELAHTTSMIYLYVTDNINFKLQKGW